MRMILWFNWPVTLNIVTMPIVARRLERNIKDVLDQIGDDKQRLQHLLTGKRVLLAEELSTWQITKQFCMLFILIIEVYEW